uniref:Uncharacterized protein n=1 Tax=Nelumbo nucifera TaxID=4432 RepID=A0A822Z3S8_NELNU|nr:TPA_asm: hypothetical protein HUJ06_008287 [Nelumbo nucifera]
MPYISISSASQFFYEAPQGLNSGFGSSSFFFFGFFFGYLLSCLLRLVAFMTELFVLREEE